MTATVLLDHVSAYAAAVRHHLRDLSPEQVEDLTDGLEADLAEALEDQAGRGAFAADRSPGGEALLDLDRRFGPAAEYAAELRAAAGLGTALPTGSDGARRALGWVAPAAGAVRRRWSAGAAGVRAHPSWPAVAAVARTVQPLWWLLRGWVWWVFLLGIVRTIGGVNGLEPIHRFVPRSAVTVLSLLVVLALSCAVGRGAGSGRAVPRRILLALTVAAVVAVPTYVSQARGAVEQRLASTGGYPVYVETQVQVSTPPEDGVRVDGQLVSNLFVYDAEGNPLEDVQVFDDRGRPVRTTYDDGTSAWSLPGVEEPWTFQADADLAGRERWNVYPLHGAPASDWTYDETSGELVLDEGIEVRTPPRPFEKAPVIDRAAAAGETETAGADQTATADDGTP